MVRVLLLLFPHFLRFQSYVALRASLLILCHVALEPFLNALLMEEVAANGNAADDLILVEAVHADYALRRLELVVLIVVSDHLQLHYELANVFSLLLLDLSLQLLFVALHLLDLPLKAADVVDADDVFVPVGVRLVHVEIDVVRPVNVAPHEAGHDTAAQARGYDRNRHR